jgi:hypothetical protein
VWWPAGIAFLAVACGSGGPCSGHQFTRLKRYSLPYAGHWVVTRGDTLTFPSAPSMSDRFRIGDIMLDTATVVVGRDCVFRGRMTFRAPRAETLSVSWFGQPEQAIVSGWPAELGPFAGVSLAPGGGGREPERGRPDSMSGAVLIDSKLGVQARPGMTARFVAGRAPRLSSTP